MKSLTEIYGSEKEIIFLPKVIKVSEDRTSGLVWAIRIVLVIGLGIYFWFKG